MDRQEFELIRDAVGKSIAGDIVLRPEQGSRPVLTSKRIPIQGPAGYTGLYMVVTHNPETNVKGVIICNAQKEAICRIDVDGPEHPGKGRSHKHALLTPECPPKLHADMTARPDLAGCSPTEAVREMCRLGKIEFRGAVK